MSLSQASKWSIPLLTASVSPAVPTTGHSSLCILFWTAGPSDLQKSCLPECHLHLAALSLILSFTCSDNASYPAVRRSVTQGKKATGQELTRTELDDNLVGSLEGPPQSDETTAPASSLTDASWKIQGQRTPPSCAGLLTHGY